MEIGKREVSQRSSRPNKRIQGTTGESASPHLQQDYAMHIEGISWQQGPGHQEQEHGPVQRGDRAPRVPPEGTSTPGPGGVWGHCGGRDGVSLGPAVASPAVAGTMEAGTQLGPPAY